MDNDVIQLLNPQINAELSARYFYEAFRTWAKGIGYVGAQRQAACYSHYHKHALKKILNLYANWEGKPTYPDVPAPQNLPNSLPDYLAMALVVETNLMNGYNSAVHDIFDINMGIYKDLLPVQKKQVNFFHEWAEFNDRLKLMNKNNGLDLVYFDRKVLRW